MLSFPPSSILHQIVRVPSSIVDLWVLGISSGDDDGDDDGGDGSTDGGDLSCDATMSMYASYLFILIVVLRSCSSHVIPT